MGGHGTDVKRLRFMRCGAREGGLVGRRALCAECISSQSSQGSGSRCVLLFGHCDADLFGCTWN